MSTPNTAVDLAARIDEIKAGCKFAKVEYLAPKATKALLAVIHDLETIENPDIRFLVLRTFKLMADAWEGKES